MASRCQMRPNDVLSNGDFFFRSLSLASLGTLFAYETRNRQINYWPHWKLSIELDWCGFFVKKKNTHHIHLNANSCFSQNGRNENNLNKNIVKHADNIDHSSFFFRLNEFDFVRCGVSWNHEYFIIAGGKIRTERRMKKEIDGTSAVLGAAIINNRLIDNWWNRITFVCFLFWQKQYGNCNR